MVAKVLHSSLMEGIPRGKFALTATVAGIVGLLLNPSLPLGAMVWPPAEVGMGEPSGSQVALLMVYGLVAAAAFGIAAAWLFFGYAFVRRSASSVPLAVSAHLSVVWLLGSWVPHDALHATLGLDLWALIGLEWGFHATLIAAGLVLARFVYRALQQTPWQGMSSKGRTAFEQDQATVRES